MFGLRLSLEEESNVDLPELPEPEIALHSDLRNTSGEVNNGIWSVVVIHLIDKMLAVSFF